MKSGFSDTEFKINQSFNKKSRVLFNPALIKNVGESSNDVKSPGTEPLDF